MATKTTKKPEQGNKPVKTFRMRGVKVAIFENVTQSGQKFFKATIQRVYKDGDEWKTTASLSREDLPVARLLLGKAWEFIMEVESTSNKEEAD